MAPQVKGVHLPAPHRPTRGALRRCRDRPLTFGWVIPLLLAVPCVAQTGPLVTTVRLLDKNGNLLPSGQVTSGSGFTIVVEGQPGPSHFAVGDVTFNSQPNDPSALPDLQIRASQPLGDGKAQGCQGGVPGTNDFLQTQPVADAINAFACRFTAHVVMDDSCFIDLLGTGRFIGATSTIQFCSTQIDSTLAFGGGDTVISVRLRDVQGNLGPVAMLTVSVPVTGSPTPTSQPGASVTPSPISATPAPTATSSAIVTGTAATTATVTTETAAPTPTATRTSSVSCVGDCNGNHAVAINELIIGVNITLGTLPVSACPAFQNAQGTVDIAQLIKGVDNALNGCG
jgi:hypothetical protein